MYVCVRACMRARVMHDSFLIELSSCLKTVRFSSTFFYGTFEWCLLSVSFPLLVRKHTDGQQNKLIFFPFYFIFINENNKKFVVVFKLM